jgi:hypothetical protein
MLLYPERDQSFRKPVAEADRSVHAGVTGRTERDQPFRVVDAGAAVVNVKPRLPCPADLAAPPVAVENRISVTGKRSARVGVGPVADAAEASDSGDSLPAGAKQRCLGRPSGPMRRPGGRRGLRDYGSGGRRHFQ